MGLVSTIVSLGWVRDERDTQERKAEFRVQDTHSQQKLKEAATRHSDIPGVPAAQKLRSISAHTFKSSLRSTGWSHL